MSSKSVLEKLATPALYTKIMEHMRSHLSLKTLSTFDVLDLEISEIVFAAFTTQYHFELTYRNTETVQSDGSSLLILPGVQAAKPVEKTVTYIVPGVMVETLEPGAEHVRFDFNVLPAKKLS